MARMIFSLLFIWGIVIVSILFVAATSSGVNDISKQAAVDIGNSGNMSEIVGVQDAVEAFPVWKWFIPPLVGLVASATLLFKNRSTLRA